MANNETARLAVLIDADNASASVVKELLEEVAKYGTATVKRAYGDWTTTNLVGWKEHLHRHAIQPMQQFAYTKGKNSTDSAFIIDAMDLLYAGNLDGFCLVSSDSDFTRLATRMRDAGKVVYGLGERKTPRALHRGLRQVNLLRGPEAPGRASGSRGGFRRSGPEGAVDPRYRGNLPRQRLGVAVGGGLVHQQEQHLV